jgi:hypothetical protein
LLPGDAGVRHEQDALETAPVVHRTRPRRAPRLLRQQRLDCRPQRIVRDPRPVAHTLTNGRIVTTSHESKDRVTSSKSVSMKASKKLLSLRRLPNVLTITRGSAPPLNFLHNNPSSTQGRCVLTL